MNLQKVLILGGSGFVGSHLVTCLTEQGHSVVATYCNSRPKGSGPVEYVPWDACKETLPDVDWASFDAVFHVALPYSLRYPEAAAAMQAVLLTSVAALKSTLRQYPDCFFIMASTGDVNAAEDVLFEDRFEYAPGSFYGHMKAAAELIALAEDDHCAVIRFFHPYGPGGDRFLLNRLLRSIQNGEGLSIDREGFLMNPVYITDLVDGLMSVLARRKSGIFHLAGNERLRLSDYIRIAAGELSVDPPDIRSVDRQPPGGHCGDIEQARKQLGFDPRVSVRLGVRHTIAAMSQSN